jgi:hypothetical protein
VGADQALDEAEVAVGATEVAGEEAEAAADEAGEPEPGLEPAGVLPPCSPGP